MNTLPPPDADLEARLRAYYHQRHFAPPPVSETLWTRLAPHLDKRVLTSPQAEDEEHLHHLLSPAHHAAPSIPLPALAAPPATHRFFARVSALAAALVIVLLVVAIFGVFLLAPRKTSSPVVMLDRSSMTLLSISMISGSEGWAVGATNGPGSQGVILHYHQGRWWQTNAPAGAGALLSVFMLSSTDGWSVGDKGTILHYTGGRWVQVNSPVTTDLSSVFMSSESEGWAAGDALLHYQQGTWTAVNAPAHGLLSSVFMLTPTLGWAVGNGGTILSYTGGHWQATAGPKISLNGLAMIAANVGWAVGSGGAGGNLLSYQNGQWSVVRAPDPQAILSSIALAVPGVSEEGWAVGHNSAGTTGLLLHDHDGQWTQVPSPTPGLLLGVALVSPAEGWAVGSQGTMLHYLNGTWSSYTDTIPPETSHPTSATGDFSQVALTSISMVSPDEGWAVGTTLPYQDTHYGGYRNQGQSGKPVILHYQQERWTPDQLPADLLTHFGCTLCGLVLNSISMVSAQEGWAAGAAIPPPNVIDAPTFGVLLHYTSGKWTLVNIQASYLGGIVMRSTNDGWMIGGGIYHYDGYTWAPVNDPALARIGSQAISAAPNGDIWISGIDYSVSVGDGFDGNAPVALLRYDGTRWSKIDPHLANAGLSSLAFVSPGAGWAVGTLPNTNQHRASESDGLIAWYHNGVWQVQTHFTGPFGQTSFSLTGVAMISPEEGWAVGNDGVIMHYQSGAWKEAPSPTGENLSSLIMVSASEGWAVGAHGTILHYQNGAWSLSA